MMRPNKFYSMSLSSILTCIVSSLGSSVTSLTQSISFAQGFRFQFPGLGTWNRLSLATYRIYSKKFVLCIFSRSNFHDCSESWLDKLPKYLEYIGSFLVLNLSLETILPSWYSNIAQQDIKQMKSVSTLLNREFEIEKKLSSFITTLGRWKHVLLPCRSGAGSRFQTIP